MHDLADVSPSKSPLQPGEQPADVPMDVVEVESESKAPASSTPPGPQSAPITTPTIATPNSPPGPVIDVCFEASKLPLDVAIFNSSRAAGGDDKIRKYLQAVLVIGGTALIPGIAHALESR